MRIIGKLWLLRRKLSASPAKFKFLSLSMLCLFAFLSANYMGVFTHLFEKDYFTEFSYPLEVDLPSLIGELKNGEKPSVPPLNVFNYTYIKPCVDKCPGNVNLLFVIKSALSHFERRKAIRQTWGHEQRFLDVEIRRVFLLGTGANFQQAIDEEDAEFYDIVQTDFQDSYANNTLKTMSGFRWVVEHCKSVRYIVFSDDDMYISTRNLLHFVRNPSNYPDDEQILPVHHRERSLKVADNSNYFHRYEEADDDVQLASDLNQDDNNDLKLYAGYAFHSSPHRHRTSKWYVPLSEYPYHLWPPYVTAGAYVLSRDALVDLHYGSFYTKFFRFDDIFLALVAIKTHIEPVHCPQFHYWKKEYSTLAYRHVIASHGYGDPRELLSVWNEQKAAGYA